MGWRRWSQMFIPWFFPVPGVLWNSLLIHFCSIGNPNYDFFWANLQARILVGRTWEGTQFAFFFLTHTPILQYEPHGSALHSCGAPTIPLTWVWTRDTLWVAHCLLDQIHALQRRRSTCRAWQSHLLFMLFSPYPINTSIHPSWSGIKQWTTAPPPPSLGPANMEGPERQGGAHSFEIWGLKGGVQKRTLMDYTTRWYKTNSLSISGGW